MTISYNLGIPNAPNNPSTDQPNMKTNNDNIALYVAVDHVAFGSPGSGQHSQVTFFQDNVPSLPTPNDPSGNKKGILFTNTVGAGTVNQLFYYAGTAAQSSTQYVASANGSTFLLGGIILKWGSAGTIGIPLSFPVAFPNNCFVVQVIGTSALYTGGFVVTAVSSTAFTVQRTSGVGSTGYYYLAIGN